VFILSVVFMLILSDREHGLAQAAEVCSGGDQLAGLEVIDRLAGKSLVVAEPGEDGTRYRLLDTGPLLPGGPARRGWRH
jgi:hypothetical protein